MIDKRMKTIVKVAMEHDIIAFCNYKGYKGAMILRISSESVSALEKIKNFAKSMKLETNDGVDVAKHQSILYVVFEHLDVYGVKKEDLYQEKEHTSTVEHHDVYGIKNEG